MARPYARHSPKQGAPIPEVKKELRLGAEYLGRICRVQRAGISDENPRGTYWRFVLEEDSKKSDHVYEITIEEAVFRVDLEQRNKDIQSGTRGNASGVVVGKFVKYETEAMLDNHWVEVFYHPLHGSPAFHTESGDEIWTASKIVLTDDGRCFALTE